MNGNTGEGRGGAGTRVVWCADEMKWCYPGWEDMNGWDLRMGRDGEEGVRRGEGRESVVVTQREPTNRHHHSVYHSPPSVSRLPSLHSAIALRLRLRLQPLI